LTGEKVQKSRSRSSDAALWSGAAKRASVTGGGGTHRPEPSRLGKRRLSLQEWLLGSLPALPYASAAPAEEEARGLLDAVEDREGGNYGGLEDGFGISGQHGGGRTRRSLDNSFRASAAKKEKPHNRRSSTSAVGHHMYLSHHHHHSHHGKKKAAQPVQYESFRDLTRKE
jgi:hypothetical protein